MGVPGERAGAGRNGATPELTAVVPVYGCRDCLEVLHARLTASLQEITADYEIVFIDDRSPDRAWDVLRNLAERDPNTVAVRLSRNFGQHAAITAGLEAARGDWVVVLDCDLQDPPEEIRRLYAKALEGYDVVYAQRRRSGTSEFRRLGSRLYFRVMNIFAGASFEDAGSFSIVSRQVVDEFLRFKDRHRHYLLMLHWLGFDTASIEYEQPARHAGKSSYGVRGLIAHALDGMFFQTTVLLRWVVLLGFGLSALGLIFALYVIVAKFTGSLLPGFASLAIFTLIIGGFIIVSTGITGLYIGRVFEQVRERPLFVVDSVVGGQPVRSRVGTRPERQVSGRSAGDGPSG
jgi:glycosyltransferase involved in cell wall biosynthesis